VPTSAAPEPVDPDVEVLAAAPPDASGTRSMRRIGLDRVHPRLLASVALGGAIGAGSRDLISTAVHVQAGSFPWSTFWINVAGSFLLGVGLILILERFPPSRYIRPFFASGICGGFTTFSTYVVEADLLVHARVPVLAVSYLVASVVGGLGACGIGMIWGRSLPLELAPLFGHRVRPRRRRARG
jgi:CrcB protein